MRGIARRMVWAVLAVIAAAVPASAQPAKSDELAHATALEALAGAAVDSTGSGLMLGGAVTWGMNSRFVIEGAGEWFSFNENYDAFAASVALRARIGAGRRVRGFAKGGIGLYRADFGGGNCGAVTTTCGDPALPSFYKRRWQDDDTGAGGRIFTDPSLVAGAGADILLTRRFGLRPAADARIVLRDGHAHVVTSFGVAAVVQFEHHPVTPSRR